MDYYKDTKNTYLDIRADMDLMYQDLNIIRTHSENHHHGHDYHGFKSIHSHQHHSPTFQTWYSFGSYWNII